MSRRQSLVDRFAQEVVAFGPIAVTRRTVHTLVLELSETKGAADFFAWSQALSPTDAPPLSLEKARAALCINDLREIGSDIPPRAAEVEPPVTTSVLPAGGSTESLLLGVSGR